MRVVLGVGVWGLGFSAFGGSPPSFMMLLVAYTRRLGT